MSTTVGRLRGTEGSPPCWNRCRRNAPHKLRRHDQAENPYILFGAEPVGADRDPGIELAPNSPLEQAGFELVVPRCVVGGRLADDIAESATSSKLRRATALGRPRAWRSARLASRFSA